MAREENFFVRLIFPFHESNQPTHLWPGSSKVRVCRKFCFLQIKAPHSNCNLREPKKFPQNFPLFSCKNPVGFLAKPSKKRAKDWWFQCQRRRNYKLDRVALAEDEEDWAWDLQRFQNPFPLPICPVIRQLSKISNLEQIADPGADWLWRCMISITGDRYTIKKHFVIITNYSNFSLQFLPVIDFSS